MSGRRPVELVDLRADPDSWTIGGKATGLHRLAVAGMPVPPGQVIPAEAVDDDLGRLASGLVALWPGTRLAVRSSAVGEDSAVASFAGQFDTVLDVAPTAAAIAAAVRRVRGSADTERTRTYGAGAEVSMAVLAMPMVPADVAGIAFTREPVSGDVVVVIEAVHGTADRLAAGEGVAERWVVAEAATCASSLGVLDSGQANEIAELARRVEEHVGAPQDIEWAIAAGTLHLLQTRPITALDQPDPVPIGDEIPPGPWEWDSAHSRAPASPLMADVFPETMRQASQRLARAYGMPLDHIDVRAVNGYFYTQVVPLGAEAGASPPPAPVMRLLFLLLPSLRRCEKTARRSVAERSWQRWHEQWWTEVRPDVERTLDGWFDLDLSALSAPELADRFVESIELHRRTFGWNMVTDPAYLVPLAELSQFLTEELGVGFETTIRLVAGSSHCAYRGSIRSLADQVTPAVRRVAAAGGDDVLDRLESAHPGFAAAFRCHQRRYGTLVLGYDLADPTLIEDPAAELHRIVTLPPDDDCPTASADALAADLADLLPSGRRTELADRIASARASYWIREEGESANSAAVGAMRLMMLAVGRRLCAAGQIEAPDHAAFLTAEEVTGWLHEPTDVSAIVRTRRGQHRWAAQQTPPRRFGPESARPDLSSLPRGVAQLMTVFELALAHDMDPPDVHDGADGVPASAGTYTGPVRVVRGARDFVRVGPGEVLVAPITNSTWEVLFPHIGALVTEGGGLLSHPAIVAREYGLPAVVGCEGATARLRDGQIVTVDGTAGTVTPRDR